MLGVATSTTAVVAVSAALLSAAGVAGTLLKVVVREAPPFPANEDPRGVPRQWSFGKRGDRRLLVFPDGRRVTATALALRPRLFHLRHFLSKEEVKAILATAPAAGFSTSEVTSGGKEDSASAEKGGGRRSWTQFVVAGRVPALGDLLRRVADLVGLPYWWLQHSNLQVLRYGPGEHYKSHYDSMRLAKFSDCRESFLSNGRPLDADGSSLHCPRFATVLYYLSDVPPASGGETCFPLADDKELLDLPEEARVKLQGSTSFLENATQRCLFRRRGSVLAAPRKGDAIVWYNHLPTSSANSSSSPSSHREDLQDLQGGAPMGELDMVSLHMALPISPEAEGVKYAANHWLNVPWWPEADQQKPKRQRRKNPRAQQEL